ncbi:hypothetical protein [Spiroplasma endosymbiont of Labia minor]|uniref:hypothetical protein n=1 Tax=Spiroplasma endosymbiont of Labia minor TaxID=3066305 RepID=UPI0030CAAE55
MTNPLEANDSLKEFDPALIEANFIFTIENLTAIVIKENNEQKIKKNNFIIARDIDFSQMLIAIDLELRIYASKQISLEQLISKINYFLIRSKYFPIIMGLFWRNEIIYVQKNDKSYIIKYNLNHNAPLINLQVDGGEISGKVNLEENFIEEEEENFESWYENEIIRSMISQTDSKRLKTPLYTISFEEIFTPGSWSDINLNFQAQYFFTIITQNSLNKQIFLAYLFLDILKKDAKRLKKSQYKIIQAWCNHILDRKYDSKKLQTKFEWLKKIVLFDYKQRIEALSFIYLWIEFSKKYRLIFDFMYQDENFALYNERLEKLINKKNHKKM